MKCVPDEYCSISQLKKHFAEYGVMRVYSNPRQHSATVFFRTHVNIDCKVYYDLWSPRQQQGGPSLLLRRSSWLACTAQIIMHKAHFDLFVSLQQMQSPVSAASLLLVLGQA